MSEITKNGNSIIISPVKDLVATIADEFKAELLSLVDQSPSELIIDLAKVGIVDSSGISAIISTYNLIKEKNGQFSVVNASENIYKVFVTMRLNYRFSINEVENTPSD